MKRLKRLFLAGLVIALLVFAMLRYGSAPPQQTETAGKAMEGGGDTKNEVPVGVGEPLSPVTKKSFSIPFVGNLALPSRSEKLSIKVTDAKTIDLDVTTFFDGDGRVCRVEYSRDKNWKRKWSDKDTEEVYQAGGETIHGLYSGPFTYTWDKVFALLWADVDLAAAKHFNMTRVEYGYGKARIEVFVCNVYGARGLLDPQPGDDDNNKVRYLVIPSRNQTLVDDLL